MKHRRTLPTLAFYHGSGGLGLRALEFEVYGFKASGLQGAYDHALDCQASTLNPKP